MREGNAELLSQCASYLIYPIKLGLLEQAPLLSLKNNRQNQHNSAVIHEAPSAESTSFFRCLDYRSAFVHFNDVKP